MAPGIGKSDALHLLEPYGYGFPCRLMAVCLSVAWTLNSASSIGLGRTFLFEELEPQLCRILLLTMDKRFTTTGDQQSHCDCGYSKDHFTLTLKKSKRGYPCRDCCTWLELQWLTDVQTNEMELMQSAWGRT
jgi:hypothetical protein